MRRIRPLALLLFLSACGGGDTPSTGTKSPGVAARVDIITAPTASVAAGAPAGAFVVRVVDAAGTAVPGVSIIFGTVASVTLSPLSGTTDANGTATTTVAGGTVAGSAQVRASAIGVATSVAANVAVVAGPATKVASNPKTIRLTSIGDTVRIVAAAQDQYGNTVPTSAVTWSAVDPTLVSVDQLGLVRVLKQGGTTLVLATSGSKADTTAVTVLAANASICTGLATATTLAVGESATFSGSQYGCVGGAATGAEFALVAYNSGTDQTALLNISITGAGLAAAPAASALRTTPFTSPTASATDARDPDNRLDVELLNEARQRFGGRFASARVGQQRNAALRTPQGGFVSRAVIPPTAKVGDILTLNMSAGVCSQPSNRGARVVAVGSKSVVLADTLNPADGFVTADYQRIAANFDTLVYPLDVGAFGPPGDIDANGKVAIIFTRTVNELVDATSGYFVGGFFNYRDIFPKKGATAADDCPGSNEGEMFYMVVPAPNGINGVSHTVGFVDSLVSAIVAHEFQHLINAERRLYVNVASEDFETVWLNEGLSHVAEELLYYRQSGWTPRQNLNDSTVRILNPATYAFFPMDAASNFSRLGAYLADAKGNSPFANDDQVTTRGATWSFLRYAADQLGSTDGTLWQKMVNSTSTGMGTLQTAFGTDPAPFFRNWAVANFMDDFAGGTDPKYQHKSWNYRSIFTFTYPRYSAYPLVVTGLANNVKSDAAIRSGSASYYRFALAPGKDALLTFSSGGGSPASPLQFVVVRTK